MKWETFVAGKGKKMKEVKVKKAGMRERGEVLACQRAARVGFGASGFECASSLRRSYD